MIILVDLDGVLADFELGFLNKWQSKYPHHSFVSLEERRTFYLSAEYPPEFAHSVREIYCAPNFYRDLPPIAGGLEAVQEMARDGAEVLICSSPLTDYKNCVAEKYDWVVRHLGV